MQAPQPAKTGAGGGSATAVAAIVIESQAPPADSDEPQTPTAADAGAAGHPFDSFGSPISAIEGAAECTAGSSPASSKEAQVDFLNLLKLTMFELKNHCAGFWRSHISD